MKEQWPTLHDSFPSSISRYVNEVLGQLNHAVCILPLFLNKQENEQAIIE